MIHSFKVDLSWFVYKSIQSLEAQGPNVNINHSFSASKVPQKRDHPHQKTPRRRWPLLLMGDLASAVARDSALIWEGVWLRAMQIHKQTKRFDRKKNDKVKRCEGEDSLICGASSHQLVFQFCLKYIIWHMVAFVTSNATGWRRAICYLLTTSSPTISLRPVFSLDAMPRANSWTVSWSKVCVIGRGFSRAGSSQGKRRVLMGIGIRTRHSCHKISTMKSIGTTWNYWKSWHLAVKFKQHDGLMSLMGWSWYPW